MPDAETLKAEGNKLFAAKNFNAALDKYTEAILADAQNAVLYANRAACYLNLKQYLNASSDAYEATRIDPKYAKAYARLATAHDMLQEYWHSVKDWQNALDNAPANDVHTRDQYAAGLKAAQIALEKLEDTVADRAVQVNVADGVMPWVAAKKIIPGLVMRMETRSSAWVIHEAYTEFMQGVNGMYQTKVSGVGAAMMMMGQTGHIENISNAILQDNRAFHMTDNKFFEKYNWQVRLEATKRSIGDWTTASPAKIKKDAVQRLSANGWNDVRPALSVTVRCWIMRAFIEGNLQANRTAEREFLLQAIDLLEWGRKQWEDVPMGDRGAIFERTFLRGVRSMYLRGLMESHAQAGSETLEELLKLSEEMISDVNEYPADMGSPGNTLAFGEYCKGHAYSMIGFYYTNKGRKTPKGSEPGKALHKKAAEAYIAAAECFPQDEETHAWFLNCAIERMWDYGGTLRDQLELMDKLKESQPQMAKLWGMSALAQGGRDKVMERTLGIQEKWTEMIKSGKAKLDDRIGASWE